MCGDQFIAPASIVFHLGIRFSDGLSVRGERRLTKKSGSAPLRQLMADRTSTARRTDRQQWAYREPVARMGTSISEGKSEAMDRTNAAASSSPAVMRTARTP
jgi:hypothetical protein